MIDNYELSLSVIVCCYNPDMDKLKKTINSIKNQKNIDFEIIISDDGSKAKYDEEINDYLISCGINNYQLNFLPENVGTVKNILSATKIAKGKYVKTISPGDYLFNENSLKIYFDYLERENADIAFSMGVYYKDDKILKISTPGYPKIFKNKNLKRNIILFNDYVLGATLVAKKNHVLVYLEKISAFSRLLEDMPLFYMSLLDGKRVIAIPEVLVWYEYGYGVSTGVAKNILNNDYENCYSYLLHEYNNSLVRRSYKMYKFQFDGFIKRSVKRLFFSYDYVYHFIRTKLASKKQFKNIIIDELNSITK